MDSLETKAHELVGKLETQQLAAVVQLLEVMVHDEDVDDDLSEEDRRALVISREYFRGGGEGLSFEQAVVECGFTVDQVLGAEGD